MCLYNGLHAYIRIMYRSCSKVHTRACMCTRIRARVLISGTVEFPLSDRRMRMRTYDGSCNELCSCQDSLGCLISLPAKMKCPLLCDLRNSAWTLGFIMFLWRRERLFLWVALMAQLQADFFPSDMMDDSGIISLGWWGSRMYLRLGLERSAQVLVEFWREMFGPSPYDYIRSCNNFRSREIVTRYLWPFRAYFNRIH